MLALLADLTPITLASAKRRVYLRLLTSALTMTIAAGVFVDRRDDHARPSGASCEGESKRPKDRLCERLSS